MGGFFQDFIRQFFLESTYAPKELPTTDGGDFRVSHEMLKLLCSQRNMGSHTDMILWSPTTEDTFIYHHAVLKPFGHPSPDQCPHCLVLQGWILDNVQERKDFKNDYRSTVGMQDPKAKEAKRLSLGKERVVFRCRIKTCGKKIVFENDTGCNWQEALGSDAEGYWQGVRLSL